MADSSPPKTALVTGASAGIGRDLAELLARDGYRLILTARNQSQLDELADKLHKQFQVDVIVIAKDLSLASSPVELFEQTQREGLAIDCLVNNAGFGTHGPFAEAVIQSQLAMLQVNVVALTHLTRLFLPGMLQRKNGKILNVASTAAFLPGPLMAVYYASKAYVLSFSEALDAELKNSGVTVTALCPGPTVTEFHKRAGIADTALSKANTMASADVARIGYSAMMRGRRRVITGVRNRLLMLGTKFSPRSMATAIAMNLNSKR